MARIKLKRPLPDGYTISNGRVIRKLKSGGRTGDQDRSDKSYGLVTIPQLTSGDASVSAPIDPSIRRTLKAVPRAEANLEAERGETVLTDLNDDGTFELYDIGGKRHHKGGTPLNLPAQSFVYSDTGKAKFSKKQLADLGIDTKKRLTPAAVSKKYPLNPFIGVLADPTTDKIGETSAELMLDQNKMKLSQIAFMQEQGKKFDEGVPLAAHPYLVSQGIDPLEFTMKIEQKTKEEAQQAMIEQLPPEKQQQMQMLQQMMSQMESQQMQQAQGPPPGPPQPTMEGPQLPPEQGPPPGTIPQGMPPQEMAPQDMPRVQVGAETVLPMIMGSMNKQKQQQPQQAPVTINYLQKYGGDLPQAQWGAIVAPLIMDKMKGQQQQQKPQQPTVVNIYGNPYQQQSRYGGEPCHGWGKVQGHRGLHRAQDGGTPPTPEELRNDPSFMQWYKQEREKNLIYDKVKEVRRKQREINNVYETKGMEQQLYNPYTPISRTGGGVRFQQGGTVTADPYAWIWNILEYENKHGLKPNQGVANWGWTDPTGKWKKAEAALAKQEGREDRFKNGVDKQEAYDMFIDHIIPLFGDEFLPGGDQYNPDVLKNLASYTFNTGRKFEDILLRAVGAHANASDLNKAYDEQMFVDANNIEKIQKLMQDPNAVAKVNSAIGDAYNTQKGYTLQNPHPGAANWVNHRMPVQWTTSGTPATSSQGASATGSQSNVTTVTSGPQAGPSTGAQPSAAQAKHDYEKYKNYYTGDDFKRTREAMFENYKNRAGANAVGTQAEFDKQWLNFQQQQYWLSNNLSKAELDDPSWDKGVKNEKYNAAIAASGMTPLTPEQIKQGQWMGQSLADLHKRYPDYFKGSKFDYTGVPDDNYMGDPRLSKADEWFGNTTNRYIHQLAKDEVPEKDIEPKTPPKDVIPGDIPPVPPGQADFWLQDMIKANTAVSNKNRINKYYSSGFYVDPERIRGVYDDPTQRIAAINSQKATADKARAMYSGPQSLAAFTGKSSGEAMKGIAGIVDRVNQFNVQTANKVAGLNAQLDWGAQQYNTAMRKRVLDENNLVEQNYDNAMIAADTEIANQIANAYTNRANTYNMNSLYDQYEVRPGTGGMIDFKGGRGRMPGGQGTSGTKADQNEYLAWVKKLYAENPEADPWGPWKQMKYPTRTQSQSVTPTQNQQGQYPGQQSGYYRQPYGYPGGYGGGQGGYYGGQQGGYITSPNNYFGNYFNQQP